MLLYFYKSIKIKWNKHMKELFLSHVSCSLVHNSSDIESTKGSVNWWLDQENVLGREGKMMEQGKDMLRLTGTDYWRRRENAIPGNRSGKADGRDTWGPMDMGSKGNCGAVLSYHIPLAIGAQLMVRWELETTGDAWGESSLRFSGPTNFF